MAGETGGLQKISSLSRSPQSPDFNFLDLAFFRSLQSDVMLMAKKNRQDLIKAVEKCFGEYDAERMAGCCESLITSYNGCLTTLGDNTYSTHGGRSAPFY